MPEFDVPLHHKSLPRDSCTCRRERLVGKIVQGWTLPPPCPACAAWDAGWVLIGGKRVMRREVWLGLQAHGEEKHYGRIETAGISDD